jgi:peptidyl-prolyl cis-trans isomerase A (cyclophilin A)
MSPAPPIKRRTHPILDLSDSAYHRNRRMAGSTLLFPTGLREIVRNANDLRGVKTLRSHIVGESIFATLHTNVGPIRLELFPNHAPRTVANFVGLAEGTTQYTDPRTGAPGTGPYYDGVIFHRVIPNFMIQGGDPTGTGRGGPGYAFNDEIHPELVFNRPYLLAMANAGTRPDGSGTNGSQFFITVSATPHLNRKHTIFGEVADEQSRKVVDAIAATRTTQDRPLSDIVINRIDIERF